VIFHFSNIKFLFSCYKNKLSNWYSIMTVSRNLDLFGDFNFQEIKNLRLFHSDYLKKY